MTRLLRLFLYFCCGFLLASVTVLSHAETMPATVGSEPVDRVDGSCRSEAAGVYNVAVRSQSACKSEAEALAVQYCSTRTGFGSWSAGWYDTGTVSNVVNESRKFKCVGYNETTAKINLSSGCPSGSTYDASGLRCLKPVYTCPDASWTLSGTTCTRSACASGYDRNSAGQCVKDCTGKLGMATVNQNYSFDGAVSEWSVGGCKVKCKVRVLAAGGGNGSECSFTGGSATPDNPEAKPLPPDPTKLPPESPNDCLAKGQGYIQGSSGVTCIPSEDAPDGQKPDKREQDSTEESGTPGPDGKPDPVSDDYKKTEKTTSSEGGKTTETTKETVNGKTGQNGGVECPSGFTLNGDGTTCSKTSSKVSSDSDFCQQNPQAAACKADKEAEDSTFGGSCDAGFTCTGDAATCAIAKASFETRCIFSPDETTALHDSANPGGTAADVAAGDAALNKAGTKDFDIASEFHAKNQAYINFSSGCPVGLQSFTIGKAVFTLDGEIVCSIGNFVKLLIHIVAYMALIRLFAAKLV